MMSVRHDSMTRFTSRGRQRRSEDSIRRCGSCGRKPRTQMGLRGGYQVWPDLVTRAECIKVSQGAGIPEHTVTLSPRLVPDALVGNAFYYYKDTRVNRSKYDTKWHKNTVKHLR